MKFDIGIIQKSVRTPGYEGGWKESLPSNASDLAALSKKVGDSTIKILSEFSTNLDGFHLDWRWADPDWEGLNACGQVRFPGAKRLLKGDRETGMKPYGKGYENHLWSKQKQHGWEARFEQFLLIDDLGLGNAVLFDCGEEKLYFWLFNVGAYPLDLRLQDYFETAFRFRGLYLWQKFYFANGEKLPDSLVLIHHLQIPRLFPELAEYVEDLPIPEYLQISKIKKYKKRLDSIYRKLMDTKAESLDCSGSNSSTLQTVNKVIQSHGIEFDTEILACFVSAGTQKYDWEFTLKDGTMTGGNFAFFGLDEMFGGPEETRAKNVDWDFCTFKVFGFGKDEEKSEMYQRFFNDRTLYWEAYCQVLLVPDENGRLHLEIMYDVDEINAYPVPFPTFVDKLIATCGMEFWAYHLAPKWLDLEFNPFEEPLKEVFPDIDTEGFQFHS